ncbi:MAG: hypothetical protein AB1486_05050 [Planctomycetota bacterium]
MALQLILASIAYAFLDADYRPAKTLVAALALVLLMLAKLLLEPWSIRRSISSGTTSFGRAVARGALDLLSLLALAFVLALFLDDLLRPLEAIGVAVTSVNLPTSFLLRLLGIDAACSDGFLHAAGHDGLLSLRPSIDRFLLRPHLLVFLLWYLSCRGRRPTTVAAGGIAVLIGVLWLRYSATTAAFCLVPEVLVDAGPSWLARLYASPIATTISLATLAIGLGWIARRFQWISTLQRPHFGPAFSCRSLPWAALSVLGIWVLLHVDLPGPLKTGRILFDDSHVEYWGRSDRRMDREWYGDYSTYNFNAAVEWLGHRYPIAVNRKASLDSGILDSTAVLVLKTPSRPFSPGERSAIEAYVRAGGSLLAIADHTDLHGMSTFLNEVIRPFGLRFEFDALSDGEDGSFNRYESSLWRVRPASLASLEDLEFMTPCSLWAQGGIATLLILPRGARDAGDYANPSNFGFCRSQPRRPYGPVILSASKVYGRGRVAAFTDSTIFSSFAAFSEGHDDYLLGMMAWLMRESVPWIATARWVGALIFGTIFLFSFRQTAIPALAVILAVAIPTVTLALNHYHVRAYSPVPPHAGYRQANVVWKGAMCAFPPSLGGVGDVPLGYVFDTLLTDIARCGVWPQVVKRYADCFEGKPSVLIFINPVDRPPAEVVTGIEEFVRSGGSLIVVDRYRAYPEASASPFLLEPFGITIVTHRNRPSATGGVESVEGEAAARDGARGDEGGGEEGGLQLEASSMEALPHESELSLFSAPHGAGKVFFVVDSYYWSREGLAHAFTLPGSPELRRLHDLYRLMEIAVPDSPGRRDTYEIIDRWPPSERLP